MDNNVADISNTRLQQTKVIFCQDNVLLRSSYYPISEHISLLTIKIGNKHIADAQAMVYDGNGNLLFHLDIEGDDLILDMKSLQGRQGVLKFKNNYYISIN